MRRTRLRAPWQRGWLLLFRGEDFGALAREWSGASNAVRGGEFGWITPETLTQDVWELAIGLDVGAAGVLCGEVACTVYQRQE